MKKITLRIDEALYNKLKEKTENNSINSYLIELITDDVFDYKNNIPTEINTMQKEIKKLSKYSKYQFNILRQLFANEQFANNINVYDDKLLKEITKHNYDFYD